MSQIIRPNSTINAGGFTAVGYGGGLHIGLADNLDSTFITDSQSTTSGTFGLAPPPQIPTTGPYTLFIRASKDSAGGNQRGFTASFSAGGGSTSINIPDLTNTITTYQIVLPNLSYNWNFAQVEISTSGTTGGNPNNRRSVNIYDVWVEVPLPKEGWIDLIINDYIQRNPKQLNAINAGGVYSNWLTQMQNHLDVAWDDFGFGVGNALGFLNSGFLLAFLFDAPILIGDRTAFKGSLGIGSGGNPDELTKIRKYITNDLGEVDVLAGATMSISYPNENNELKLLTYCSTRDNALFHFDGLNLSNYNLRYGLPNLIGFERAVTVKGVSIGNNNLNSELPTISSTLNSSTFRNLELFNCNFFGQFDLDISTLTGLRFLLLQDNNFTGVAPSIVTNAGNIIEYNINNNGFTGININEVLIPTLINDTGLIRRFTLSNNPFPQSVVDSIINRWIELYNSGFTGYPTLILDIRGLTEPSESVKDAFKITIDNPISSDYTVLHSVDYDPFVNVFPTPLTSSISLNDVTVDAQVVIQSTVNVESLEVISSINPITINAEVVVDVEVDNLASIVSINESSILVKSNSLILVDELILISNLNAVTLDTFQNLNLIAESLNLNISLPEVTVNTLVEVSITVLQQELSIEITFESLVIQTVSNSTQLVDNLNLNLALNNVDVISTESDTALPNELQLSLNLENVVIITSVFEEIVVDSLDISLTLEDVIVSSNQNTSFDATVLNLNLTIEEVTIKSVISVVTNQESLNLNLILEESLIETSENINQGVDSLDLNLILEQIQINSVTNNQVTVNELVLNLELNNPEILTDSSLIVDSLDLLLNLNQVEIDSISNLNVDVNNLELNLALPLVSLDGSLNIEISAQTLDLSLEINQITVLTEQFVNVEQNFLPLNVALQDVNIDAVVVIDSQVSVDNLNLNLQLNPVVIESFVNLQVDTNTLEVFVSLEQPAISVGGSITIIPAALQLSVTQELALVRVDNLQNIDDLNLNLNLENVSIETTSGSVVIVDDLTVQVVIENVQVNTGGQVGSVIIVDNLSLQLNIEGIDISSIINKSLIITNFRGIPLRNVVVKVYKPSGLETYVTDASGIVNFQLDDLQEINVDIRQFKTVKNDITYNPETSDFQSNLTLDTIIDIL